MGVAGEAKIQSHRGEICPRGLDALEGCPQPKAHQVRVNRRPRGPPKSAAQPECRDAKILLQPGERPGFVGSGGDQLADLLGETTSLVHVSPRRSLLAGRRRRTHHLVEERVDRLIHTLRIAAPPRPLKETPLFQIQPIRYRREGERKGPAPGGFKAVRDHRFDRDLARNREPVAAVAVIAHRPSVVDLTSVVDRGPRLVGNESGAPGVADAYARPWEDEDVVLNRPRVRKARMVPGTAEGADDRGLAGAGDEVERLFHG